MVGGVAAGSVRGRGLLGVRVSAPAAGRIAPPRGRDACVTTASSIQDRC